MNGKEILYKFRYVIMLVITAIGSFVFGILLHNRKSDDTNTELCGNIGNGIQSAKDTSNDITNTATTIGTTAESIGKTTNSLAEIFTQIKQNQKIDDNDSSK